MTSARTETARPATSLPARTRVWVIYQENKGTGMARNAGMDMASDPAVFGGKTFALHYEVLVYGLLPERMENHFETAKRCQEVLCLVPDEKVRNRLAARMHFEQIGKCLIHY